MASLIVNRGLQVIGGRASDSVDSFEAITSLSVDDSDVAFAAGDTALNSGGAVTNEAAHDFDTTPTRFNQTVSHTASFDFDVANFTIKRIALHNAVADVVSTSSATLIAGIDGQSLTKSVDFILTITVKITYTSA